MHFRLLGPLEVCDGAIPITLSARKVRALLARLLLDRNRTVAVAQLVEDLWGEDAPDSAVKMVQVHVSQLRKLLPANVIETRAPGYLVKVAAGVLDLDEVDRLRAAARDALEAGDAATASRRLTDALALWRGPALADFDEPFAIAERRRLDELYLTCLEDRVEADLATGRHAELVGELESVVAREPLRERLRRQLMLALYRSGRQAEALTAYQTFRRTLDEGLGIEPSPALKALHQQILVQDPALELPEPRPVVSAPPAAGPAAPAGGDLVPGAGGDGPFVGRRQELDRLEAALTDALGGTTRVMLLAGEPGIGKTRTSHQLAGTARERGALVVEARCYADVGAPPYWPWVQVLRPLVRSRGPDEIARALGSQAAELAAALPELAGAALPHAVPADDNPKQARFRFFEAVVRLLEAAAAVEPLALVLDDLHDANEDSLILLEFVARELGSISAAVLVIGTYRDTEVSRGHPLSRTLAELTRARGFDRITLRGLHRRDARRYIELTGLPAPEELVAALETRTGGNPLFLREMVRLLQDEHEPADGGATGWERRIPDGVRDVIGRRLRRLSEACNEVLQLAAVGGTEFALDQLVRLGGDRSAEQTLGLVEEALTAHIIEPLPGSEGRIRFTHALFQECLVAELAPMTRAALHARIARDLEEAYGPQATEHASELARHFREARPLVGAQRFIHYATIAGEQALAAFAYEDALALFESGLSAGAEDAPAARLLFGLGRAQLATRELHELDAALANLRRAFDCYERLGDVERAVAVAAHPLPPNLMYEPAGVTDLIARALELVPRDSTEAAHLLSVYGWLVGINHADHAGAQAAFDRALDIAGAAGDTALEVKTLVNAQYVHMFHLRWSACLETGRRAATLARRVGDRRGQIAARGWVARALIAGGELKAARAEAAATLADAAAVRDRYWLATSSLHNALVALVAGDWQRCRDMTDRGLAARPHDPRNLGVRAYAEYQTGAYGAGAAYLERMQTVIAASPPPGPGADYPLAAAFLPLCDRAAGSSEHAAAARDIASQVLALPTPTPYLATCAHLGLGLIAVAEGDPDRAATAYAAIALTDGEMLVLPPISRDRMLALLADAAGRLDEALAHFERALVFCTVAGYRPEQARVAAEYADALVRRDAPGDADRAETLRRQSRALEREIGLQGAGTVSAVAADASGRVAYSPTGWRAT